MIRRTEASGDACDRRLSNMVFSNLTIMDIVPVSVCNQKCRLILSCHHSQIIMIVRYSLTPDINRVRPGCISLSAVDYVNIQVCQQVLF
jgi:hypothetical protein